LVCGLSVAALLAIPAYGADRARPPNNGNETDAMASQLSAKLNETDKKGILVLDLQPAFGRNGAFGSWFADRLSLSIARQLQEAELIDRRRLEAARQSRQPSPGYQSDVKNAVELGRSVGAATVVVGSYQAAENGIGITLVAYRLSEYGLSPSPKFTICVLFSKIPLAREVTAQLGVQIDSLKPKDGVYRSGYGGVTIPACIKCPAPTPHVPDIDLRGMLRDHPEGATIWLQFVVTAEGHTQNVTVLHPVGYGFDEQYAKAAADWEFTPAVDADKHPVPVTYVFHYSFVFK